MLMDSTLTLSWNEWCKEKSQTLKLWLIGIKQEILANTTGAILVINLLSNSLLCNYKFKCFTFNIVEIYIFKSRDTQVL